MEVEVARWLVSDEAAPCRDGVHALADPMSLKAGTDLRKSLSPSQAAAVLELETLRRKGRTKLGEMSDSLYLTREGLEQATRWDVACWRAERLTRHMAGTGLLLDVGCGLGIDSLGLQQQGWTIVGIEKDPVTAVFAEANLAVLSGVSNGVQSRVINAALEDVDISSWLADPRVALFLDPARRTSTHRSWDVADLSPSWESVLSLVGRSAGPVTIKVGPGFPHTLIPDEADVTWVSHRGDLVETTLWFPGSGQRTAVVLGAKVPEAERDAKRRDPRRPTNEPPAQVLGPPRSLNAENQTQDEEQTSVQRCRGEKAQQGENPSVVLGEKVLQDIAELSATGIDVHPGPLGEYLYEPDPAVTRAHATGDLSRLLGAHRVAESIAYLTSDALTVTPFAEAFHIDEVMDYSEKTLHKWVKARGIGILEIKTRGLKVDPAILRRTLKPRGNKAATLILTPMIIGVKALVVSRISA